jgi:hypothetical protein
VEHLALEIGERHVRRPAALHAAEAFIRGTWAELGYDVTTQTYDAFGIASANLEITIRGTSPVHSIRLVAFVNEEPPFFYFGEMGSRVYARAARARGDDIALMLSLEMLGCFRDVPGSQRYPPLLRYLSISRQLHRIRVEPPLASNAA